MNYNIKHLKNFIQLLATICNTSFHLCNTETLNWRCVGCSTPIWQCHILSSVSMSCPISMPLLHRPWSSGSYCCLKLCLSQRISTKYTHFITLSSVKRKDNNFSNTTQPKINDNWDYIHYIHSSPISNKTLVYFRLLLLCLFHFHLPKS